MDAFATMVETRASAKLNGIKLYLTPTSGQAEDGK
jgi:hypothetical protein